jgi:hypothetical protein
MKRPAQTGWARARTAGKAHTSCVARGLANGALALCLLSAVLAVTVAPSSAAVRLCEPSVSSGPVEAATEKAARAGALASWTSKASAHGVGYASWRLAARKFIKCLPVERGGFTCLARAAPCTIEQAPARRHLRQKRIGV